MLSVKQLSGFMSRKAITLTLLLLPIGCLLWQWSSLPPQVPMHFSRGGADSFGDKHMLIGFVLIPLLLYAALPFMYPAEAENDKHRQIGTGVMIFLSLVLCVLLLVGILASR
ncbi:DUF1648 domain-containing protein [Hymenobacter roseosalivarius]|uniref:DUF1648 domain-containing protein n=1 Tax=Hymenobacter roseosalivarius TaxID=89967 RepID=UPI000A05AAAA